MATPSQIFNEKSKFLDKREALLKRKVTTAERKLLNVIIDKFVDKLDVSGGVIQNNDKNIKITQGIQKIFEEFDKQVNAKLIEEYGDDILKGQALNETYFSTFDIDKKKFGNIKNDVRSTTNRRLGISSTGKVVKGGFLDNFIGDSTVKTQVQQLATEVITGESSRKDALNRLKRIVVGDAEVSGQLQNQYRTFIYDTYAEVDALESDLYANAIGLESAFYLGGTIKTTRRFCCQRNGNLYTVKEINAWNSLTWKGKKPGVPTLIQRGGYNCRHRLRYISNKVAVTERRDLTLSSTGKLIKNGGASQKYNSGCDK